MKNAAKGAAILALLVAALVFMILFYPLGMTFERCVLWGLVAYAVVSFSAAMVVS